MFVWLTIFKNIKYDGGGRGVDGRHTDDVMVQQW